MVASSVQKPKVVYPARKHAAKVFAHLVASDPFTSSPPPSIFLQGHSTSCRDDTDRELPFRQEANFMYLTGASSIRGASALISLSPTFSGRRTPNEEDVTTTLFLPPIDPLDVMWSGLPASPEEVHASLPALSKVVYQTNLPAAAKAASEAGGGQVLTLPATKIAEGLGVQAYPSQALLKAIHEARAVKSPEEISLMRYANHVSSAAHDAVLQAVGRGEVRSEGEAEAVFLAECAKRGAKAQAYESIFAYGSHASTLHYVANSSSFSDEDGMLLIDAGCEFECYASDITRTVPVRRVGGKGRGFTKEGREVYEVVLGMQEEAMKRIKAGADWEAIQLHMHLTAARGLLKLGIFRPGSATAEELVEKNEVSPFFPHGIGHFLGIDTHDVAGLPEGRSTDPRIKYLRLRRPLEVGHVVTVEPGLYFNQFLLEPAKKSAYVDDEVLELYVPVGGVRIEDNVVVTETGYDNLTIAAKSVEDVERLCSGP